MYKKKRTKSVGWRAPAVLSLLALLPGCTLLIGERFLYADLRSYKIERPLKLQPVPRDMRVPQSGEIVKVATLNDGNEAIELTCSGPDWIIPKRDRTRMMMPAFTVEALEETRYRESGAIARELCIDKAVRVCRLLTSNGASTFALLDEYEFFGRINAGDDEADYGRRIYIRCMKPRTFREWARSVDKGRVSRSALKEWKKFQEDKQQ